MRMKHRWIGGLLIATALTLGACAPPNQGGQSSDEPSRAAESSEPAPESAAPATESSAPSGSAEPTPDDYEY